MKALDLLLLARESFDPSEHPRLGKGPGGGRFRSLATRLADALAAGEHDPVGKLSRPQLRSVAKQSGIEVRPRAPEHELRDALRLHFGSPPTPSAKIAKKAASPAPAKVAGKAPKKSTRAPATPVDIHALMDADDATIEAAMRDVYEGKFGPYTTKIEVSITRAGTRTDKRGKVHQVEPSIGVSGKVYDESGYEIGYFDRSIGLTELLYDNGSVRRREVWATHHVVQLGGGDDERGREDTKYHGKGFGGEFNRRAIEWYRASGVHGIGQSDHNGYVWASQGFNFSGGVMPEYKQDELRQLIADLRARKAKDQYAKPIPKQLRDAPDLDAQIAEAEALLARIASTKPGEPGYPTAYEVSQLGRNGRRGKTKTWVGKFLGVSAGELILNPDEGEVVDAGSA